MEVKNPWFIEGSSKARLISATPDAEETIAYIARVTSKNQENPSFERLLRYCIKQKHWSIFEQASMTVEVVTPLAIAVQLLRHNSLRFQQFSGRYESQEEMAKHTTDLTTFKDIFYMPEEARTQDVKNRQNSIPAGAGELTDSMWNTMSSAYTVALMAYQDLLNQGIAKEIARFVLPQGVFSRLYVTGNCRSWIHYLGVRDDEGVAQFEHCELARSIRPIFSKVFPTVSEALKPEPTGFDPEKIELQQEIAVLEARMRNRL